MAHGCTTCPICGRCTICDCDHYKNNPENVLQHEYDGYRAFVTGDLIRTLRTVPCLKLGIEGGTQLHAILKSTIQIG